MEDDTWSVGQAVVPVTCSLVALILGYTALTLPPWYSKLIAPVSCSLAFVPVIYQNNVCPNGIAKGILAKFHMIWIIYIPFLVYIKGYNPLTAKYEGIATTEKSNYSTAADSKTAFKQRHWLALKMLFNARGIGTEWQIKTIRRITSPGYSTASRLLFCTRRTFLFLSRYAVLYIWLRWADTVVPLDEVDYSPEKQIFLRRLLSYNHNGIKGSWPPITFREVMVRAKIAVDGNLMTWAPVDAIYHALAIFFVVTGIDSPEEWPPLFGSILEAYTVRRWWSIFWHSLLHRMLSGYASLVLREVLLIRGKSVFSHLSHSFLVFLASGMYHGVVSRYSVPHCDNRIIINYYMMQALGLSIETVIHSAWLRWRRKLAFHETWAESVFTRLIGYFWVLAWFCWVDFKASFAYYRCNLSASFD